MCDIHSVCVCVYLSVCVVVDVAGRDHMTDGICLRSHFLFYQQRQIHNLEEKQDVREIFTTLHSLNHVCEAD